MALSSREFRQRTFTIGGRNSVQLVSCLTRLAWPKKRKYGGHLQTVLVDPASKAFYGAILATDRLRARESEMKFAFPFKNIERDENRFKCWNVKLSWAREDSRLGDYFLLLNICWIGHQTFHIILHIIIKSNCCFKFS